MHFAQNDELFHTRGEHVRTFAASLHVLCVISFLERTAAFAADTSLAGCVTAAAKYQRTAGAIKLWKCDHHGRFHRQQATVGFSPALQSLKLHWGYRKIRYVHQCQKILGGFCIVISRSSDQGKACQRYHRIDTWLTLLHEELVDCGPCIQSTSIGRTDRQTACLKCSNDTIIVTRVARQQVGAHQQQTYCAFCIGDWWQQICTRCHAFVYTGEPALL